MTHLIKLFIISIAVIFSLSIPGISHIIPLALIIIIPFFMFRIKLNKYFIIQLFTLVFSVLSYFISSSFGDFNSFATNLGKLLYPVLFILSGYFVSKNSSIEQIEKTILLISLSLCLFAILSYFKTLYSYGTYNQVLQRAEGRILYSFWNNTPYAATLINAYLSLFISLLPLVFLKNTYLSRIRLFFIMLFVSLSTFVALSLGNRTALLLLALSSTLFILTQFRDKKYFSFFKVSLAILLIVTLIYTTNIIDNLLIFDRFNNLDSNGDPRFAAWNQAIDIIKTHPLGNSGLTTNVGYAHNLWLDVGMSVGIIPMFGFILFYIQNSFLFFKTFFMKDNALIKYIILCISTAFTTTFFLEPIFEGLFNYFCIYCFFIGLINNIAIKESTLV